MQNNDTKSAIQGAIQNLAPPLASSFGIILDALGASISPAISVLFASAYGLFGYFLYYQQEKLNSFATWIKDHPEEFCEEMVIQPAFQEGFFLALEAYLKARGDTKRALVKKIFLDFATEEDKEEFELERFLEITKLLSAQQIESLRIFSKNKRQLLLLEQDQNGSYDYYHTSYELLRSLESSGILLLHTDIKVHMRDTYSGDAESGLDRDGAEPTSKKVETIELTDFGISFLNYVEEIT